MIRDICTRLGVPADAIRLEDRSTTTAQNLTLSQPLLDDPPKGGPVVIVTDLYHLPPRARLVARRLGGMRATGGSAPPPLKGRSPPWRFAKMCLREVPALIWYLIRPQR